MRSAKKQERKYRTVNTTAPHTLRKRLLTLILSFLQYSTHLTKFRPTHCTNMKRYFFFRPFFGCQTAKSTRSILPAFHCKKRETAAGALLFMLLTGVRVTKFYAAPAQGRRSRWAWTKSRSCRFPARCGDPRQRRWRSWQ